MGRPGREENQGGTNQVVARGSNKEHIFKESIDKSYLVKQLYEYSSIMSYVVYGYVFMSFHPVPLVF